MDQQKVIGDSILATIIIFMKRTLQKASSQCGNIQMKHSLLSTSVAVFLSINVQVKKDGHTWLASRHSISLTWLLAQWYLFITATQQFDQSIRVYLANLGEQPLVAGTMFGIGYRSILYGLGVSL